MDDKLLNIYQGRMDKCTTEQFWMVALMAAMGGFLITQKSLLAQTLGARGVQYGSVAAFVAGILFVISRHKIYARYAEALRTSVPVPGEGSDTWRRTMATYSGVVLYCGAIAVVGTISFVILGR